MSSHYTIVNDNYITVNNIFNDCIINLCGFRFFWDTLYIKYGRGNLESSGICI